MRLLVLGGTVFLGRHVVEEALARRFRVTLFHRGRHGAGLFPEAETVHGDRDGGLSPLRDRTWDAVVDTSGYLPRVVRESAELLRDAAGHYTFVSSLSVYRDVAQPALTEAGSPLESEPPPGEEDVGRFYGGLKVACERVVDEAFPGRSAAVRAGLIVGPHDPTGRFTYWVTRTAAGGEVLAPGRPQREIQFVDVRDLAGWILRVAETGVPGAYNAVGPGEPCTMGRLLDACRVAAGSDARLTWVDEAFLAEHGVEPWSELPLWLPEDDPTTAAFFKADCSRAVAEGLTFRPVEDTVRDTLTWARSEGGGVATERPAAGIAPGRETELLEAWRRRVRRTRMGA